MTTQTTHQQTPVVTMTPVSKNSVTIAGEPELYLSTPEPEATCQPSSRFLPGRSAMDDASLSGLCLRA